MRSWIELSKFLRIFLLTFRCIIGQSLKVFQAMPLEPLKIFDIFFLKKLNFPSVEQSRNNEGRPDMAVLSSPGPIKE